MLEKLGGWVYVLGMVPSLFAVFFLVGRRYLDYIKTMVLDRGMVRERITTHNFPIMNDQSNSFSLAVSPTWFRLEDSDSCICKDPVALLTCDGRAFDALIHLPCSPQSLRQDLFFIQMGPKISH